MTDIPANGYMLFSSDISIRTSDLVASIGKPISIKPMPLVQTLTPRNSEAEEASSYSGLYGMSEFPLHTDLAHWVMPPRYFLLRCIMPASDVSTTVLHSHSLIQNESKATLSKSHFRPRRRLDGRFSSLKILNDGIFRWDQCFIEPLNKNAESLRDRINLKISEAKVDEIILENPGDCILIDNWSVLHGRTQVTEQAHHRKYERVYLSEIFE